MSLTAIQPGGLTAATQDALSGLRQAEELLTDTASAVVRESTSTQVKVVTGPPPDDYGDAPQRPSTAEPQHESSGPPDFDVAYHQIALVQAQRAYEANMSVLNAVDIMGQRLLRSLGQ
ncbi:hypothetical protein NON00_00225 [Roseomonas sp. GC11]|uniref:flagellar basal body rod C-terminal domain-containing protein n=1 Tax=Roseomonas sp. GC11 TaxID=2950546 RepID=UPI0021099051|nr:flagellar basal body rod C-terminal domain-containing protein [Roseomonas sp. GC11]MCQ4158352.1 hypothetical protein [Roseomonas sp. GC11]